MLRRVLIREVLPPRPPPPKTRMTEEKIRKVEEWPSRPIQILMVMTALVIAFDFIVEMVRR